MRKNQNIGLSVILEYEFHGWT